MRTNLPSGFLTALTSGRVVKRSAVWIVAKNRTTGAAQAVGFWNGKIDSTFNVIDGITRSTVSRPFVAIGSLLGLDDIPMTSDLSVREMSINLSPINDAVENAIRGYDAKFAPVQIYRVLLDRETRLIVGAGYPRFVGFINGAPIIRAAVGDSSSVQITIVSQMRELTKSNPDVRSKESQTDRTGGVSTDNFFQNTDDVGHWIIPWGQRRGKLKGHDKKKPRHAKD